MFVQTVLIWLVSATTLAMPPPLSMSTPLQTTPPSMPTCKCDDDKVINPGEEHYVTDCVICKCNEAYQVSTEVIDCFFKECVDSVKTPGDKKCCPTCPKGPNCYVNHPGGKNQTTIPAGAPVDFGDYQCQCPTPGSDYFNYEEPTAVCMLTPQTTIPPPPKCVCSDRKELSIGEKHHLTDCEICECNEQEGVTTYRMKCEYTPCVKTYSVEGDGICCPSCPNGPDCEAVYGPDATDRKIIPAGKPFRFGNTICSCDDPDVYTGKVPRAVCFEEPTPPTTTTTTYPKTTPYFTATPYTTTPKPECICEDGVKISPGQTHFIKDCYTCRCDAQYRVTMRVEDCYYLACVDSFDKPNDGICCPKCPNGPNCEAFINGVRHIIPDNGTFYIGDINCTCQPLYFATFYGLTREATCTVPLATSTLISTPPTGPEPTG